MITFSRGKVGATWEVEMNQFNRATWVNDYLAPLQPTPAPPDASVPAGTLRLSTLPVQDIVNDVIAANLGLSPFICFTQDGGGFLSEFIAYHGVWYQSIHESPTADDWCVAAGHVHVGTQISWPVATLAAEVTLRSVIEHVDAVRAATVCQADLGYGGPGKFTGIEDGYSQARQDKAYALEKRGGRMVLPESEPDITGDGYGEKDTGDQHGNRPPSPPVDGYDIQP